MPSDSRTSHPLGGRHDPLTSHRTHLASPHDRLHRHSRRTQFFSWTRSHFPSTTTPVYTESSPFIEWADSGCYWDSYYGDYIWCSRLMSLTQTAFYDVAEVYADVYDDYWGEWVETPELLQESPNPDNWFSDWMQYSTYLDCGYSGYTVEFVVYDSGRQHGYCRRHSLLRILDCKEVFLT